MQFNFNFGNKKPNIKTYAIVGLVLSSLIAFLSHCTGIPELTLWDFFDEVQREVKPGSMFNDYIIKDPEKLQRRIHRDVDRALEKVTPEYDRIIEKDNLRYKPRYIEEKNNEETCYTKECKSLAPPMRICSPWYEKCINTDSNSTKHENF